MQAVSISTDRYARVIANSKRVRWDIEDDVIRGRRLDLSKPFLPSGLSLADELPFLQRDDRRLFSQIQGRSYAYIFGLVERFIAAKMLEVSREHGLGDQVALEPLVERHAAKAHTIGGAGLGLGLHLYVESTLGNRRHSLLPL